ncbi:ABC transporter ATP-binding protein [Butyricicoccus sp.]|uniref:ABC transporter ATP-binding protein n=1 Tax=Butyricicoccus sp. TaxID=2049021 RepID=UPI003735E1EF
MHRGPGGPPGAAVEKAKNFRGTLRKLVSYIGRYRFGVLAVLIFAVGSTIFNITGPKILSKSITVLYEGLVAKISGTGAIDFARIGKILLVLLGVYLLSSAFSFIQGWIMTGITQKVCFRMRREISEKINRLPLGYFESRTVGEVLSRITNDVDTLGQSLNQSVTQLITSVTTIVGVLIMMLTISPLMTLIALVILPVSLLFVMIVVRISQKYFRAQQKYLGDINGQIEETFSGHNVVRVFNQEERTEDVFNKTNDKLYESAWKSQFLSGLMHPLMQFVGNLGYVGVAVAGSMLAVAGTITVGDIQAFIQYVRNFTQPITQLAQVSNMLQSMAAAAERVFEFLDEKEEDQTAENPASIENIQGAVQFDHVKFGYDPRKPVIHDFTCDVRPGQMVAIVGPTGAGKTTMVKLLMRFYDVDSGAIRLDGHDVREFNRSNLREGFGMVLQDTWLFKGTIMENIRYGRLDATDEEVIAAAKAAHADHFIQTLPGGYQMELNEEISNVSQGQKQLLTIARAILADNPVLILDEATSSVDTRTEALIQSAMNRLMEGRTSFVIAHRLSTIREADVILVMRDGDIVEQGTHHELLDRGGFYAELYNSQFAS